MKLLPVETRTFLAQFARQLLKAFPHEPSSVKKERAIQRALQLLTLESARHQQFPGVQNHPWDSLLTLEASLPILSSVAFSKLSPDRFRVLAESLRAPFPKLDDRVLALAHEFFLDGFPSRVTNKRPRKKAGAFYTPPQLAKHLAKRVLGPWKERIAKGIYPALCDPAAGHGQLLQGALEVMLDFSEGSKLPRLERLRHIAEHSLFAFDTNKNAIDMAAVRLILKARKALPGLCSHFVNTDPLREREALENRFDLFFGNPPYGLKHPKTKELGLNSQDCYGAFLMLTERLKDDGEAMFIVSDTFLTLESHRPLREKLLARHSLRGIQFLPSSAFRASVETVAVFLGKGSGQVQNLEFSQLRMKRSGQPELETSSQCALEVIRKIPSKPFSTALPSLLPLFFETSEKRFEFRGQSFVRLGDHVDIRVGLQTGDNNHYLRQLRDPKSLYRQCEDSDLISTKELLRFSAKEKLHGVDPKDYSGRSLIPFDKGGKSLNARGQLADYYRPPSYAIDWSQASLTRMREHKGPNGRIQARMQNMSWFFRPYIVASRVGAYSPSFRLGAASVFDSGCTGLFVDKNDVFAILGLLCSSLIRYLFKTTLNHTVNSQADDLKRIPLPDLTRQTELQALSHGVTQLVRARVKDPESDTLLLRGRIDEQVYKLYGVEAKEQEHIRAWLREKYPGELHRPQETRTTDEP